MSALFRTACTSGHCNKVILFEIKRKQTVFRHILIAANADHVISCAMILVLDGDVNNRNISIYRTKV